MFAASGSRKVGAWASLAPIKRAVCSSMATEELGFGCCVLACWQLTIHWLEEQEAPGPKRPPPPTAAKAEQPVAKAWGSMVLANIGFMFEHKQSQDRYTVLTSTCQAAKVEEVFHELPEGSSSSSAGPANAHGPGHGVDPPTAMPTGPPLHPPPMDAAGPNQPHPLGTPEWAMLLGPPQDVLDAGYGYGEATCFSVGEFTVVANIGYPCLPCNPHKLCCSSLVAFPFSFFSSQYRLLWKQNAITVGPI